MWDERRCSILTSLLFMGLGVFVCWQALSIKPIVDNDVGSGYMPKVVGSAVFVLAALKLLFSVLRREGEGVRKGKDVKGEANDNKGGLSTIAALVLYVLSFEKVGFLITTALYLFVQISILSDKRNRNLSLFAVVSVSVTVIVYFLFTKVFDLMLPQGILYF